MQLAQAFETLNDADQRRRYDASYPNIAKGSSTYSQSQQAPRPTPTGTPRAGTVTEVEQIAALRKSKQDRNSRWRTRKDGFDSAILEVERDMRRVRQEIDNLTSIAAAEAAEAAKKNSWSTWLLSSLYKPIEESEHEKARKDRARQERRLEKDMKERKLSGHQAALRERQQQMAKAQKLKDAADLSDEAAIQRIEARIRERELREREAMEKAERERQERIRKEQQEKQDREWREHVTRAQAEREKREQTWREQEQRRQREQSDRERRAALRRQQEQEEAARRTASYAAAARRRQQQTNRPEMTSSHRTAGAHHNHSASHNSSTSCDHGGWWGKVHGRTACPECGDIWNYLLKCPSCVVEACPKCQRNLRPGYQGSNPTPRPRAPPRARTPCPHYGFRDEYDYW